MAATTVSFLWINTIYSKVNLDIVFKVGHSCRCPETEWSSAWDQRQSLKFCVLSHWPSRFTEDSKLDWGYETHAGRDQHHRHQQFVKWCSGGVFCFTDLNLTIFLLIQPHLNPPHDGNNVFQRKYVVLGCKKWCIYIWNNYINTVLQITKYTIIDTNTLWTMSKGGQ